MMRLVWATRGRVWGFRFLLDGGLSDPLPTYEQVFSTVPGRGPTFARDGALVGVRFPDPLGRTDASGRVIPHDVIVLSPDSLGIETEDECRRLVWAELASSYSKLWDLPSAPTDDNVRQSLDE